MAIAGTLALAVGAGAVLAAGPGPEEDSAEVAPPPGVGAQPTAVPEADLGTARTLLAAGAVDEAERLAESLSERHPYAAAPRMLLGDVHMRRNDAVAAVHAYRAAVLRDPDLLDRKAAAYQGRKIERAVQEALAEVEEVGQGVAPTSERRSSKRMLRVMQRRIAGSCD